MIIKTIKNIACKCPFCGSVFFDNFSAFELSHESKTIAKCKCGLSSIGISVGDKCVKLTVPCFACEGDHTFYPPKSSLLGKNPILLSCPETTLPVCCVGSFNDTQSWADDLDELIDSLYEEMQEADYFAGEEIVYGIVKHVGKLADDGKVLCPHGHDDFEYTLTESGIILYCCVCGAKKEFQAQSNEDLQNVIDCDRIILEFDEKSDKIIKMKDNEEE